MFRESKLIIARGLRHAVMWGAIGFLTSVLAVSNYSHFPMKSVGSMWWWRIYWSTALGPTWILACTAWAARAPRGGHSFAKTLTIVFFVTVPLWFFSFFIADQLGISTLQRKGDEAIPLWIAIGFYFLPPLFVAIILTVLRMRIQTGTDSPGDVSRMDSSPAA